ncbi:tetratricopeptide repeat protein [Roseiconus lacunae]|uniref:tetratricopeptide repeat protein n=1 Tax=Roseiconus lacunae TaxID=2605694 RepID=UPI0011F263AA|nr:tetratricopeptide repeat protein [Roseiconus lacunae]
MKRTVNSKLVIALSVLVAIAVISVFSLHRMQAGRTAGLFLNEARDAAAEEEYAEALRSYQSHLRLDPDSTEGLRELGELYLKIGEPSSAAEQLERLLIIKPDDRESRRMVAKALLLTGRYSDVKDHIDRLDESDEDAELQEWLGRCALGEGAYETASDRFRAALEIEPDRIDVYPMLSAAYRRQPGRESESQNVMEELTELNPSSARAHFLKSGYHIREADVAEASGERERAREAASIARQHAMRAAELDPDKLPYLLLHASCESKLGDLDSALTLLRNAVEQHPSAAEAHLQFAKVYAIKSGAEGAASSLEQGIKDVEGPGKREMLIALANLQLDSQQLDKADVVIKQLQTFEGAEAEKGYLAARLGLQKEDFKSAIAKSKEAILKSVDRPLLLKQLHYVQGMAFRQTGDYRSAEDAFRQAISTDPNWVDPQLALVETLSLLDETEASYQALEKAVSLPGVPAAAWLAYAQATVRQTLVQNRNRRNWAKAEAVLEAAARRLPGDAQIASLKASVLSQQGDTAAAADLLQEVRSEADAPEQKLVVFISEANLAIKMKNWDRAASIIAQAENEFPGKPTIDLLKCTKAIAQDPQGANATFRRVVDQSSSMESASQRSLLGGLSALAGRFEQWDLARSVVETACQRFPKDVSLRNIACSLAVSSRDIPWLMQATEQLKSIEGESATWHLSIAQATWLVVKNENREPSESELQQIESHLEQAKTKRSDWPLPYLLEADVALSQKQNEKALHAVTTAIDQGVRTPSAIRTAVALSYEAKDYDRASELLQLIDADQITKFEGLGRTASLLSIGEKDHQAALEMARRTAADSTDAKDHLWLARLTESLLSDANPEDSETLQTEVRQAYRQALKLDPKNGLAWIGQLAFLNRYADASETEAAFKAFRQAIGDSDPFLIAQSLDALGKTERAIEWFGNAIDQTQDVTESQYQLAIDYFMSNRKYELASQRLAEFADRGDVSEPAKKWERRTRATLAIAAGNLSSREAAITLISKNLNDDPDSFEDLRLQALLYQVNGETRQAVKSWKQVAQSPSSRADDHYQYAISSFATEDWSRASEQIRLAISKTNLDAQRRLFIGTYVSWMLSRNELSEAELWIDRFEEIDDGTGAYLTLRARLNARRGRHAEAIGNLKQWIIAEDDPNRVTGRRIEAARLASQLAKLGDQATAENPVPDFEEFEDQQLRLVAEQNDSLRYYLVRSLLRRNQIDQAIRLLGDAPLKTEELSLAVPTIDAFVVSGKLSDGQLATIDSRVDSLINEYGESFALLGIKASAKKAAGDFEAAEAIYRGILEREPENAVALNNLAVQLLDQEGRVDEAASLADKAIASAGPVPALLDTRATIAIAQGESEQALQWLSKALPAGNAGPAVFLFHRAAALHKLGREAEARESFETAIQAGLNQQGLGKRERRWFESLQEA